MKLLIETLTEKILTVAALKENVFQYQDKSDQCPFFRYFGSSSFHYKKVYALFSHEITFYGLKTVD